MQKTLYYLYENKGSDQLRGNRAADLHICFRYIDSAIPLLPSSKTLFLMKRLLFNAPSIDITVVSIS